jgi:MFS family permease
MTLEGSANTTAFELYIEQILVPSLHAGQIVVKRSFNASTNVKKVAGIGNAILEGLHYVLRSPILFWLTLLLLLFNFILPTADVQIVWYAKQWLRASDTHIGLLYASDGIGVMIFSLPANRLRKRWSFGVVALGSMMVLGLLTVLMAFTHSYLSVFVIWALRGGTDVLFLISAYSITQLVVPNALLGRVITESRARKPPCFKRGMKRRSLCGRSARPWTA